jgi:hypothetical protein
MNTDHHVMELASVDADGLQEWVCTSCRRRIRFHWTASITPTVLEPGDETAAHVEPVAEPGIVEHASGLSAIWLEAITRLDLSVLADGEENWGFPT